MVAARAPTLYFARSLMISILKFLLRVYKWTLSPFLAFIAGPGGGCRFEPTCSEYAVQAMEVHGLARGSWLALKRVCRCHPWGGMGYDPVPARDSRFSIFDSRLNFPSERRFPTTPAPQSKIENRQSKI